MMEQKFQERFRNENSFSCQMPFLQPKRRVDGTHRICMQDAINS